MFNTRGTVTSPGYPGNISRSTDCQWELSVPLGMLIHIDFPGKLFPPFSSRNILAASAAPDFSYTFLRIATISHILFPSIQHEPDDY